MIRRVLAFASVSLLAACVGPQTPPPPTAPMPAPRPAPAPPVYVPPAPAPTPPAPAVSTAEMEFDAWRRDFLANRAGPYRAVLERELAGLTPDARVITSDMGQPEFSRPVGAYLSSAVSPTRIANGRAARSRVPQLAAIEQRFGVPAEIVLGIWGMETAYGSIKGDQDVVRSIATLAAQGRRRAWAEAQLIAVARMLENGDATRPQLRGSWAGAMGHTQFIPATYLDRAVDGDGDGDKDIWNSEIDALASAANLLARAGWVRGGSWHVQVELPSNFDYAQLETVEHTPAEWARLGVRRADGGSWNSADAGSRARLIAPAGAEGPKFLTFPNHMAIRAYNNSISYALAVGMIADALAGRDSTVRWPTETPLSLADRRAAQAALTQLGFDTGGIDGVTGVNTRRALRQWQQARGRTADGHLDAGEIAALKREVGLR